MEHRFLILSLLVSINIFSQQKSDSSEIIDLLKEDYTMVGLDIKTNMENCTADYLLIEDGEIWNMEKEVAYYRKMQAGLLNVRIILILNTKKYWTIQLMRFIT